MWMRACLTAHMVMWSVMWGRKIVSGHPESSRVDIQMKEGINEDNMSHIFTCSEQEQEMKICSSRRLPPMFHMSLFCHGPVLKWQAVIHALWDNTPFLPIHHLYTGAHTYTHTYLFIYYLVRYCVWLFIITKRRVTCDMMVELAVLLQADEGREERDSEKKNAVVWSSSIT